MNTIANWKGSARKVCGLLVISAAFALAMPSIANAEDENTGLAAPIEGTWIMQVHRVQQNITFTAMQSFAAGGVTQATGTIDRIPAPPISLLFGTWRRIGHNSYANSLSFFIFDPAGNAVAMLQNYSYFHLTANGEIVGTGEAYACDPNGDNCVDTNTAITFIGKRMHAQYP